MRADYIKLRDQILKGFESIPGLTCTVPQGAFYVYPNVSQFFGKGGVKSASDIAAKPAERGARGGGSGRGVRHEGAYPVVVCGFRTMSWMKASSDARLLCRTELEHRRPGHRPAHLLFIVLTIKLGRDGLPLDTMNLERSIPGGD